MTRTVFIGNVAVGGGAPVSVQSMCNIPFSRPEELKQQALRLQSEGCEILRVSVPDALSAERFADLKRVLSIPLVADIHFDHRLALAAMRAGADKIRINPGNFPQEHLKEVVQEARQRHIPIRVGVNAGSLEKDLLRKYGAPTAQALAESAARNVQRLEELDFHDIVVSVKTSDVPQTVEAYRLYDRRYNEHRHPLHIGVTEAGTLRTGLLCSAAGIGALLLDGIGDTVRVSLSAYPTEEVRAAKTLLRVLGLRKSGLRVVSCPTCGRTTVNSIALAERLEQEFGNISFPLKIAVMGCVVNGIGEAGEADFGVTGTNGSYVLFRGKTVVKKDIPEEEILDIVRQEIRRIEKERT